LAVGRFWLVSPCALLHATADSSAALLAGFGARV
jgi:hypothetical protein